MKRQIHGLSETIRAAGHQVQDGLFLVRVDKAQYRWHAQKPFFILRLSILEPHQLSGRIRSGRLYCTLAEGFGFFDRDLPVSVRSQIVVSVAST
jgi:hypothetical protein